jgi:hypothetical protein
MWFKFFVVPKFSYFFAKRFLLEQKNFDSRPQSVRVGPYPDFCTRLRWNRQRHNESDAKMAHYHSNLRQVPPVRSHLKIAQQYRHDGDAPKLLLENRCPVPPGWGCPTAICGVRPCSISWYVDLRPVWILPLMTSDNLISEHISSRLDIAPFQ